MGIYILRTVAPLLFGLLFVASVFANTVVYEYDAQDRIISATYPNLTKITYEYDALGNRMVVSATAIGADADSDGIPDSVDLFPNDANEWSDNDGDGYGDNSDQLPHDPFEHADFDGDLIGDNADTDDDNDGALDVEDDCPLNPRGFEDLDADGLCNGQDADSDGDGTPDDSDDFPRDPSESTDTDKDGIGNNADTDDDNDGVEDIDDICPLDPSGITDIDENGVCDNANITANGFSLWNALSTPKNSDLTSSTGIEVGVKFVSSLDGYIMGVRYYKASQNTGVHTGALWDARTKKKLISATFSSETDSGWQQVLFDAPFPIEAGKTYVASYYSPQGTAIYESGYFSQQGVISGPLSAPSNAVVKGNGVYKTGSKSVFPKSAGQGNNYWVDIVFEVDGDGINPTDDTDDDNDGIPDHLDNCPLDPQGAVDTDGDGICDSQDTDLDGDGVANDSDAFPGDASESVDTDGDGIGNNADDDDDADGVIDGYDACPLDASGFRDLDGDSSCDNENITSEGLSLWGELSKPENSALTNTKGIETGVKFVSSVDGYVMGVRFYKTIENVGTHIGNLWDEKKKILATIEFVAETESGWQQALFDEPVQITAGKTYTVSYYSPQGNVIYQSGYFSERGVISGPLSAPSDKVAKGNGVFKTSSTSKYPSAKSKGKNYWVDVVFEVDGDGINPTDDFDDDDDDIPDLLDACPFNPQGASDIDMDGFCDSQDPDMDGDDVANDKDVFPTDPLESIDTDGDGTGNNADTDDDNDQVIDGYDHCPLDPAGYLDTDGDGSCDNEIVTANGLSLWSELSEPEGGELSNEKGIEAGVKFVSNLDGYIMGIRFYKAADNIGTHTGTLWDAKTKQALATATFSSETESGWQEVSFAAPLPIEAGKTYIASYYSPNGNVVVDEGYFSDQGIISGPLSAASTKIAKGNGVYKTNKVSKFPSSKGNGKNYWVDVVFEVDGDGIGPADDFDDDDDGIPDLIDRCQYNPFGSVDTDGDGVCDSQDPDLDGDNVLNDDDAFPNDPFESVDSDNDGTGNNADLDDDNDNTLDEEDACPVDPSGYLDQDGDGYCDNVNITTNGLSLWNNLSTPQGDSVSDSKGIEAGVKFVSSVDGYIMGIRFYKADGNTGIHIGTLWDEKKKKIESVVFTGEAEVGWQQALFASPVPIEAGKTYTASYHSPQGNAVYQTGYFAEHGIISGPLSAPSDKVAKGNGVYKTTKTSKYPSVKSKGKNYWVDVVFEVDGDSIEPIADLDDDNDDIPDLSDACPYNPQGAIDTDGDGICDSQDSDLDGDGVANDNDYYPYDPAENADTDEDGLGNNTDVDDDNDGVEDQHDDCPLDPAGHTDSDGDTYCDNANYTLHGLSFWHDLSKPISNVLTGPAGIEVGMAFTANYGATVKGIRFYKSSDNVGTHTGSLWDANSKERLASVVFVNETTSGWQEALFETSVPLEFGKTYVVSYYSPNGLVQVDDKYFSLHDLVSGPLRASSKKNGFYRTGTYSRYPSSNGKGKNYWVDVILESAW